MKGRGERGGAKVPKKVPPEHRVCPRGPSVRLPWAIRLLPRKERLVAEASGRPPVPFDAAETPPVAAVQPAPPGAVPRPAATQHRKRERPFGTAALRATGVGGKGPAENCVAASGLVTRANAGALSRGSLRAEGVRGVQSFEGLKRKVGADVATCSSHTTWGTSFYRYKLNQPTPPHNKDVRNLNGRRFPLLLPACCSAGTGQGTAGEGPPRVPARPARPDSPALLPTVPVPVRREAGAALR